jgi:hypothetical protein
MALKGKRNFGILRQGLRARLGESMYQMRMLQTELERAGVGDAPLVLWFHLLVKSVKRRRVRLWLRATLASIAVLKGIRGLALEQELKLLHRALVMSEQMWGVISQETKPPDSELLKPIPGPSDPSTETRRSSR